jgi:hypothetical protein
MRPVTTTVPILWECLSVLGLLTVDYPAANAFALSPQRYQQPQLHSDNYDLRRQTNTACPELRVSPFPRRSTMSRHVLRLSKTTTTTTTMEENGVLIGGGGGPPQPHWMTHVTIERVCTKKRALDVHVFEKMEYHCPRTYREVETSRIIISIIVVVVCCHRRRCRKRGHRLNS